MISLIALLVFAAVTLAVLGLLGQRQNPVQERLRGLRRHISPQEVEVDFTTPFVERVIYPALEALSQRIMDLMPPGLLAKLRQALIMAGSPMSPANFIVIWALLAAVFPGLLLISTLSSNKGIGGQQILLLLLLTAVGGSIPILWLRNAVQRRQSRILKALPDAIDLVTICVEAGLGLDAALARVAQKTKGPLAEELSQMLREMAMGRLRRDALRDLSNRVGVHDLTAFVNAIIQAEQLGTSIAQTLRVQADQLRLQRRQRAEQQAYQAPVKMVFPLVFLIFPALMVVILGPAAIRIFGFFM